MKKVIRCRSASILIVASFFLIYSGWYAFVFSSTYWGLITKIGSHYVDCGSIDVVRLAGSAPGPSVIREVKTREEYDQIEKLNLEKRGRLLHAFRDHSNSLLRTRIQDRVGYLFLEWKGTLCTAHWVEIIDLHRFGLEFRELDMRGWGHEWNLPGVDVKMDGNLLSITSKLDTLFL